MGYDSGFNSDSDTSIFSRMSGKELGIIIIIAIIGGFFAVQAMFGFPIKDLIRKEITEEAKVVPRIRRELVWSKVLTNNHGVFQIAPIR